MSKSGCGGGVGCPLTAGRIGGLTRPVSFGTYARRVRDPTLPLPRRAGALRSAVQLYQPLGWHATLSFLDRAVGRYAASESKLLQALDLLEESRRHWLSEVQAFAHVRRLAKARGNRTPTATGPNPLRHPTGWYGPHRQAAARHILGTNMHSCPSMTSSRSGWAPSRGRASSTAR